MPYRRLPKTDQARIKALNTAVGKEDGSSFLPLGLLSEAKAFLARFESAQAYYRQCLDNQVNSNGKYWTSMKNARMYVSHFIQVLNLAVIRSEIKDVCKELYGLSCENNGVPDLTNEAALLEWGGKIIDGEKERLRNGGVPIYNPTIARVAVHYDIFKEKYGEQKSLQQITGRSLEVLAAMRERADEIILDIWNRVESRFQDLEGEERLDKCREYGVVYYYRTGEKKPDRK